MEMEFLAVVVCSAQEEALEPGARRIFELDDHATAASFGVLAALVAVAVEESGYVRRRSVLESAAGRPG